MNKKTTRSNKNIQLAKKSKSDKFLLLMILALGVFGLALTYGSGHRHSSQKQTAVNQTDSTGSVNTLQHNSVKAINAVTQ